MSDPDEPTGAWTPADETDSTQAWTPDTPAAAGDAGGPPDDATQIVPGVAAGAPATGADATPPAGIYVPPPGPGEGGYGGEPPIAEPPPPPPTGGNSWPRECRRAARRSPRRHRGGSGPWSFGLPFAGAEVG